MASSSGVVAVEPGPFHLSHLPGLISQVSHADLTADGRGSISRERQVLSLLADGASNRHIARSLGISRKTVQNHVSRIPDKLQAADRTRPLCAPGASRRCAECIADSANLGKPLIREDYSNYFDLYWDLHLGVTGEAIPAEVRQIGSSFTTVLAAGTDLGHRP